MNLIIQNTDERLRNIEREIIANGCKGPEGVLVKSLRASLLKEEELKNWIDDLQSGNWITCVYCGHRYGPKESTPVSMADILKEHIEKCPEHPMSKLKSQLNQIKETIQDCICQKYGSDRILPHDICKKINAILSPPEEK